MVLQSDINGAQSWERLTSKQKLYLCRLAGLENGYIGTFEKIPPIERQEIREAAGRMVCFASLLGGFIQ